MAKYEDGSYGSAAGIALIAKVLAGRCAMKYTRVAVGKGNIPKISVAVGSCRRKRIRLHCRLCHGCRDCGHHQPGGW